MSQSINIQWAIRPSWSYGGPRGSHGGARAALMVGPALTKSMGGRTWAAPQKIKFEG